LLLGILSGFSSTIFLLRPIAYPSLFGAASTAFKSSASLSTTTSDTTDDSPLTVEIIGEQTSTTINSKETIVKNFLLKKRSKLNFVLMFSLSLVIFRHIPPFNISACFI